MPMAAIIKIDREDVRNINGFQFALTTRWIVFRSDIRR
jgi:hypothetical protein